MIAEDFEPTVEYLVFKLRSGLDDELEARKIVEKATQDAGLAMEHGRYDISKFIEICEAIKKHKGYPSLVSSIAITRAYVYSMEQMKQ